MDAPKTDNWMILQPKARTEIQAIDPKKMLAYMQSKGWKCSVFEDQARCYPHDPEERFTLLPCAKVPFSKEWADYESLMVKSLELCCKVEERLATDVLASIAVMDIT